MKFSTVVFSLFVSSAVALPATQQVNTNNNDLVVREQAEQSCILDKLLGLGNFGQTNGKRDAEEIAEIVARATGGGINVAVKGTLIDNVVGLLSGLLNGLLGGLTPKPAAGASTKTSFPNLGGAKGSSGSGTTTSSDLLKQLAGFAGFTGASKRELAQGSVFSAMDQLVAHIAKDMPEAKGASNKVTEAFNELQEIAKKQAAAQAAATKKQEKQQKPGKQN